VSVITRINTTQLQDFIRKDQASSPQVLAEWQQEGSLELMMLLRQNTPVRTGMLRESIARRNTPKGFTVYFTKPYDKIAGYVEYGTRPHNIFPSDPNGVLSWVGRYGEQRFAKRVFHPGFRGRFFVQRTKQQIRPVLRQLYRMIWLKYHR
jgi:hypothetical protein